MKGKKKGYKFVFDAFRNVKKKAKYYFFLIKTKLYLLEVYINILFIIVFEIDSNFNFFKKKI